VMVVLTILVPFFRRMSLVVLEIGIILVYFILKIGVFSRNAWWGGDWTYATIVEITLASIAVIIARYLGGWLDDFVNAVENITFAKLKRVRNFEEVGEEIEAEMYRSRRYQHPLAVIVARPDVDTLRMAIHRTVEEVQRSMLVRYVSISLMTRALFGQLRRTDWLLEQTNKRQYVFVLPETKGERADVVVERIQRTAEEMGVAVSCGVATFPEDALTFEALLENAEEKMAYPALPITPTKSEKPKEFTDV